MRVVLTGCSGDVGAVTAPILEAAGHEVVGPDNDLSGAPRSVWSTSIFRSDELSTDCAPSNTSAWAARRG